MQPVLLCVVSLQKVDLTWLFMWIIVRLAMQNVNPYLSHICLPP